MGQSGLSQSKLSQNEISQRDMSRSELSQNKLSQSEMSRSASRIHSRVRAHTMTTGDARRRDVGVTAATVSCVGTATCRRTASAARTSWVVTSKPMPSTMAAIRSRTSRSGRTPVRLVRQVVSLGREITTLIELHSVQASCSQLCAVSCVQSAMCSQLCAVSCVQSV